jgi:serine/threonine-protein kinase
MLMGTPAYMPPEQARGRWSEVDARSDLWAVGVTLASLMTGKRPRPAAETSAEELLAAMMQPIPSLATLLPEAPPEVIALIDRAYAFERDDRWQTAAEMQAAVRAIRGTIHGERPFPASLTMRLSSDSRSSPPAPQGDSTGPSPFYGSTLLTPPVARRSVHEVEPVPSLTTNRAMMSSAAPEPPASSRGSGTALVGIVVGLLVAVGIIALGVTVGRARWAAATATSTPAAPSASVALPLLQASATGAPAAPAVSAVGAASSVMPASDAAVVSSSAAPADRKRDKRPKPKPAGDGTTDPNSFFDKRF